MNKPIAWKTELDHTWDIKVYRTEGTDYKGTLVMKHKENETIVLEKEVDLSFGARWGADVSDVAMWQKWCIDVADAQPGKDKHE